ncbi:MAG TPA: GNAT family protein [Niallia sp.]|nr:GNAT family protein [Niallia sp.]
MFPILETERLVLREINKEDAESIFSSFSNEKVIRYYGQSRFTKIVEAYDIIDLFANNYKADRSIRWGIQLKDQPGLIGTIGLNNLLFKSKRGEIGYEIQPFYWRNGYTSEAVKSVLTYAFDVLDLHRIGAVVFLENDASNNLLKKLGFQHEGILRGYILQDGIHYDTNIYSKLKAEHK